LEKQQNNLNLNLAGLRNRNLNWKQKTELNVEFSKLRNYHSIGTEKVYGINADQTLSKAELKNRNLIENLS